MIHIDNVLVVTERAVGERQVRALGVSFGRELHAALSEASAPRDARIDTVSIELPASALQDRSVLREAARGVARRILERTTEAR